MPPKFSDMEEVLAQVDVHVASELYRFIACIGGVWDRLVSLYSPAVRLYSHIGVIV